jgi:integrase
MRQSYILYKRRAGLKQSAGVQYYVAFWDAERRVYGRRRATGKTSIAAARAQADKWLLEGVPLRDAQTLLGYLAGFWQPDSPYLRRKLARERVLSPVYVRNCRSAIETHVRPFLEARGKARLPLAQATAGLLEDLVLALREKGLSPARINGVHNAIHVPLAEAVRLGSMAYNPAARVERLPDHPRQREILSLAEVRAFFALDWPDARLGAANLVAATTGLRLGEIRGLQAADLQPGYLRVRHNWQDEEGLKQPKWGSSRDVPLPARTEAALRALAAGNPWGNDFIFYGNLRGAPPARKTLTSSFADGLRRIGIDEGERKRRGLTFHSWRHWYNSMLRGKVPDHALRALTGHRGVAMTDRYTEITSEQRAAVAQLAEGLLPGTPG